MYEDTRFVQKANRSVEIRTVQLMTSSRRIKDTIWTENTLLGSIMTGFDMASYVASTSSLG